MLKRLGVIIVAVDAVDSLQCLSRNVDKVISSSLSFIVRLYTGRVQHNTDLAANRLGGEVSSKSASDNSIGTMSPADLAPVHSELVSVLVRCFCLGNKGNSLSKVKVNVLLGINTPNFDQTNIVVLVA